MCNTSKNPYTSKMCFHLFVINGREHVIYTFSNPKTISEFPWLNDKVKNGPLFFAYYDIFIPALQKILFNMKYSSKKRTKFNIK